MTNTTTATDRGLEEAQLAPPAQLPTVPPAGATTVHPGGNGAARVYRYPPSIAKAILQVSKSIGEIAKDGENKFQNYKYQAWDDVVRALQPALLEANLIVIQSECGRSIEDRLVSVNYEFTLVHAEGDGWPSPIVWTGMARLIDSKGVMDDKAINKCATQAHKYWAIHTFSIRTPDAEDSDGDAPSKAAPKKAKEPEVGKVPHAIVVQGSGASGWARAYMAALRTADTVEAVDAWYLENRHNLITLSKSDEKLFKDCEAAFMRRKEEIRRPGEKPLPPRVDAPQAASAVPGKPAKQEAIDPEMDEVFDQDGWLRDLEGALVGTEDLGELAKIKSSMLLAMQNIVTRDYWMLGSKLYLARVQAVMGEDIAGAG